MLIAFKCPFTTPNTPWKITKPCLSGSLTGSLLIMGYLYTTTWLPKESLQWEHFCGLTSSKNRSLLLDLALGASLLARKKQQLWIVMLSSNRLLVSFWLAASLIFDIFIIRKWAWCSEFGSSCVCGFLFYFLLLLLFFYNSVMGLIN